MPAIFLPSGPDGTRKPAYTPQTENTYLQRVTAARTFENQYKNSLYPYGSNYGYGYGYAYYPYGNYGLWGSGFAFDPYLMFYNTWCDPFSVFWQFPDPACLANYGYSLNFSLYPYSFGGPFSFFGYGSSYFTSSYSPCYFDSPGIFFSRGLYSPLDLGWNDTLCGPTGYGPFANGLNNPSFSNPLLLTPSSGASASASSPGNPNLYIAGSTPLLTLSSPEALLAASSGSSSQPVVHDADVSPSSATEPLTLVFLHGKKVQATQYWLDGSGQLHFVNEQGQKEIVPATELDMKATEKANPGKGMELLSSPSPSS